MRPDRLLAVAALLMLFVGPQDADRSSLHPDNFDASAAPGVDFERWVNGGWDARQQLPAGEGSWNSFRELEGRNRDLLRAILEDAAADRDAPAGSDRARLGAFYSGCMDLDAIEAAGLAPLDAVLADIDAIEEVADLAPALARLQRLGIMPAFSVFPARNPADPSPSSPVITWLWQGGLGLPDPRIYLDGSDAAYDLREAYVAHVARMFELLGDEQPAARAAARSVLDLETRLAQAWEASEAWHGGRPGTAGDEAESLRDREGLAALAPALDWSAYLSALGLNRAETFHVGQPAFFERVDRLLGSVALADWKTYLRWKLIAELAPTLPAAFDAESFAFNQRTLRGVADPPPRWQRCIEATNGALGWALGRAFVERAFGPDASVAARAMAEDIRAAAIERVDTWDWMSAETRVAARAKLAALRLKVGAPERWPDERGERASLGGVMPPRAHAANVLAVRTEQMDRQLATIGGAFDPDAWTTLPQTTGAWYDPAANELVFPAGILQPPFFGADQDDAANYGAMGAVLGHELSHALFGIGADFGPDGQPAEWWTGADREAFAQRVEPLVAQYDGYTLPGGQAVDGRATLDENLADLAGLTFAWHALERAEQRVGADDDVGGDAGDIDGYTPQQRFFMAWAQTWRELVTDEALAAQAAGAPQAPSRFRIHGPLSQLPEFAEAFGLAPGDPLARPEAERVRVW